MPQRRKRSAAITLVLAGSLAGCSEPVPQRDVYTSLEACQRDWANAAQNCQPVRDNRYSNSWFYGPAYYGASWPNGQPRSNPNAVDAVRDERASTALSRSTSSSYSGSRSWFGGSSSSSSTSRGGFGSSGRSSIS